MGKQQFLAAFLSLNLLAAVADAQQITSATVNYSQNTLIILGTGFGPTAQVALGQGQVPLTVRSVNLAPPQTIIAAFPSSRPASSFASGSYLLTVVFPGFPSASFEVAMGAPESSVITLTREVDDLRTSVTALQTTSGQLTGAVTTLQATSTQLQAAVTTLQATVSAQATGLTSITQDNVTNAGGFPYKITQPGSYRLASNLIVPAGTDAIDITADNVTLDLNGFTISGPVTCSQIEFGYFPVSSCSGGSGGYGVYSLNNSNITVRNGLIVGMGGGGVYLAGPSGTSLVDGVIAKFNGPGGGGGILLVFGTVRNSSAVLNGGFGIAVIGGGLVQGNTILFNAGDGLDASTSNVIANIFGGNGRFGLFISDVISAASTIYGNNIFNGNVAGSVSGTPPGISQRNNSCSGGNVLPC